MPARRPPALRALLLLLLTYIGFISLGLPDGMLGVAWPFMRTEFGLSLDAISAVLVVFTVGYLVSTFSTGWLLGRMNVGMLLVLSGVATAIGLLGYATAPAWGWIVALSMIAGLGAGAIDAGLNTYAATNYSARTMNWLHACYGVGAASGPILLTEIIARGNPWQRGYLWVGVGEVLLAGCFVATLAWWPKTTPAADAAADAAPALPGTLGGALRLKTVWLGVATFFVYTGAEASVGTWAFTLLTAQYGMLPEEAGRWVGGYWASLTLGRIVAGFVAGYMSPRAMVLAGAWTILLGGALVMTGLGTAWTIAGILCIGFGCAPIFPSLVSTTPSRVPAAYAAHAVGLQMAAATLGISLVPSLVGFLAEKGGLQVISLSWSIASALLLVLLLFLLRSGRVNR